MQRSRTNTKLWTLAVISVLLLMLANAGHDTAAARGLVSKPQPGLGDGGEGTPFEEPEVKTEDDKGGEPPAPGREGGCEAEHRRSRRLHADECTGDGRHLGGSSARGVRADRDGVLEFRVWEQRQGPVQRGG